MGCRSGVQGLAAVERQAPVDWDDPLTRSGNPADI